MSNILHDPEVIKICRNATLDAFKGKVNEEALENLLRHMPDPRADSGTEEAEASIVSALIWSKVSCTPKSLPWEFSESAWGVGVGGGSCIGFMYTAYEGENAWDTFFKNVTAYHAQGIAATGGIFQINWFISNGTPVGQFNGALAGAGAFEIGGSCKWTRK